MKETENFDQTIYIRKVREKIQEAQQQLGRKLTFCVQTFGCQMNARDSEKLTGILILSLIHI